MDTIKIHKGNTRMVAHAGLCGLEMENTAAGFIAAGNRSYFGIETDLHVTKDKQIVALHDGDLMKISGSNMVVKEHTLEELQQVKLYDRFFFYGMEDYGLQPQQDAPRADLRVPSLDEYIRICKRYGKIAVPELKDPMTPEEIAIIVKTVQKHDYLDKTVFISFYWDNLTALRKLVPNQPVQFLVDEKIDFTDEFLSRLAEQHFDLDLHVFAATKERIDRLHAKGIRVNVWTVDWPARAEQIAAWGADYITSNILE